MAIRGRTPGGASIGQALRRRVFLYQDGVVLAATLRAFDALGLLAAREGASIAELCPELPERGFAHLRVGIRSLAQAGWLAAGPGLSPRDTRLVWTASGRAMLKSAADYLALAGFLARFDSSEPDGWAQPWSEAQRAEFAALSARRWTGGDAVRAAHLDGALLTPLLLSAEAGGELPDAALLDATGLGEDWPRIVAHLGLAGSYLPLLSRLPDLYRGETLSPGGSPREWHVQRELNIRASTAAHGRYFADADALIRGVLDRPLADQPALLLDTGCGDGAWLSRVAKLLPETLRGRNLAQYPLRLVGADYAPAAIAKARAALAGADALVVQGDVSDPDSLCSTLAGHGLDMADALHLHAFIDHDRSFRGGGDVRAPLSTGAFIGPDGEVLAPERVEADLAAHLARWAPYTRRHGLIALEAHCVPPQAAAHQQGALHSIAFDAYHAYSRQYPLERGAYVEAVRRAGLRPAAAGGRCYPSNRPFVAVSLNHLLGEGEGPALGTPPAGEALEDGAALHRLLYRDGDVRHPRPWCAPATNALVTRAMEVLEALPADRVVRVCDYGTGTGLAAIELLKACRERGFAGRIELLCLDIPSPWFAFGEALLGPVAGVTFRPLTDSRGFLPLAEALRGEQVDLMLASMVFHLIRPAPLARVAGEIAGVLAPGGTLLWNAPDIGPAGPWAVLFHDANRMLRTRWEAMLAGVVAPETDAQREAVAGAGPVDSMRAGRRILPVANDAAAVGAALSGALLGEIGTSAHEITREEVIDTLGVPSNHREFLPEIAGDSLRLQVIRELMEGYVLPAMCAGPAGTGLGLSVHWTSGEYRRR